MPSTKQTVLLTGASGFLGSVLLPKMSDVYRVIGIANSNSCKGLRICDLTKRGAVVSLLDNVNPDIIIHAAAMTNVDGCEREPKLAFQLNVEMTQFLANWVSTQKPATRFLYVSTDQVYDGPGPHLEDELGPTNIYALTKLWAEECVGLLANSTILRANFFGQSLAGSGGLVSTLRNSALSGSPVTLFTDVLFSPLLVDHLVEVIIDVLNMDICGIFNAGASGEGMSKAEFARAIIRKMGLPLDSFKDGSVEDLNLDAYRPRDMRMNIEQLQSALGRLLPSTEDGIRQLAETWKDVETSGV